MTTLETAILLIAMIGCPFGQCDSKHSLSEGNIPKRVYKSQSLAEKCFIMTLFFNNNSKDFFKMMCLRSTV